MTPAVITLGPDMKQWQDWKATTVDLRNGKVVTTFKRKDLRAALILLVKALKGIKAHCYYQNGYLRIRAVHPTKGWRDERLKSFPVKVNGMLLVGTWTKFDIGYAIERL